MKEKNGRISVITIIIISIVVIAIGIAGIFVFLNKDSNNTSNELEYVKNIEGEDNIEYEGDIKINNSELLQYDKYLDNYVFSNYYIYSVDGVTKIEFDVSNSSQERKELEEYILEIYSSEEGLVGKINCKGTSLAAGQTKRLNVIINADIANLSDLTVEPLYTKSV